MPRMLAALVFLTALLAFSSGAQSASQELWKFCNGTDANTAITACNQILAGQESETDRAKALTSLANAYRNKRDWDQAIDALTRVTELEPKNAAAFADRGVVHGNKHDWDDAVADYTRAIELDPNYAFAFTGRGAAYVNKGDYDRAIAEYTRAIELDPKDETPLYFRASAYEKKGDWEHVDADRARAKKLWDTFVTQEKTGKLTAIDLRKHLQKVKASVDLSMQALAPRVAATTAPTQQATTQPAKPPVAATPSPPIQQATTEPAKPVVEAPAPAASVASPAAAPSQAAPLGKRVALVIGNSAYKNTTPLPNPSNDASDVAAALKRLGFTTVIEENDLDKRGMDDAFRRFAREMVDADAAMYFYAGHAMEWQGANYLMPVDAKLEDEADVPYEMAKLNDMVADMSRVKAVRIAVLDACRDNPLENKLKRSIALTRGGAQTRGLARIEKPEGLVIAYATQTGNVAEDGGGRNSPFTAALLEYIETPGLEVGVLFRRVMGSVKQATKGKQHPELSILLDSEFYFKPGS